MPDDVRTLVARSLLEAAGRSRKTRVPAQKNLEQAVSSVAMTDTIHGSSTLEVTLLDQNWQLLDSGFFDADKNGKLDPVEVNYPDGSGNWWRLTKIDVDGAHNAVVKLSFLERAAVELMAHHGPYKASRGKVTRAQFVKSAVAKVKKHRIRFHSFETDVKQEIDKTDEEKRRDKDGGINTDVELKIKGVTMNAAQKRIAGTAVRVAKEENAGPRATLALIEAIGVECEFRNVQGSGADAVSFGVIQAIPGTSNGYKGTFTKEQALDVEYSCRAALRAPGPTSKGGLIKLAKDNPSWTPGQVAAKAINGGGDPAYANKCDAIRDEAEKIIEAGGGSSGNPSTTYRKQYNFEIGTAQEPHMDFWTALNQIAEQVNWRLFLNGQDLYFDAETTLVEKQKPVAVIKRGGPAVGKFSFTWDQRNIASEATVELVCDPFEFRAGEVFLVEGFGPASSGSTVKLPGRWLIEEIQRDVLGPFSTFTLKQPEKELLEPPSEVVERQQDDSVDADVDPAAAGDLGDGRFVWPIADHSNITGKFGEQRPGHLHGGVDFAIPNNTPVYATAAGTISFAGVLGGYGNHLGIEHGNSGFASSYSHLKRFAVHKGQKVHQGQLIAYSNNTGSSTGPHLHFELIKDGEKVDPLRYLGSRPDNLTDTAAKRKKRFGY